MSYPVYGRVAVPEPPSALLSLHLHDGATPLKEVDHETPVAVLDQSDLTAQGIHTSRFIPGCKTDASALGSCTANTYIEETAAKLPEAEWLELCKRLIDSSYAEHPTGYTSTAGAGRAAIAFYEVCTHQTGNPAEEWPPTDCGSSGVYVAQESERLKATVSQKIASGADNIVSLMQDGGLMTGMPFFYSFEEPDAQGFVDGDGSPAALEAAIQSGVAGGHEIYAAAIEKLVLLPTGHVEPRQTVLRYRNHWTPGWGDHGCFRIHLSTLVALGGNCDHRQLVV
jgi:hypothetical protein